MSIVATADGAVFFGGDPRRGAPRRATSASAAGAELTDEDLRDSHTPLRLVDERDTSGFRVGTRWDEAAA